MTSDVVAESVSAGDTAARTLRLVAAYLAAAAIPVLRHALLAGGARAVGTAGVHLAVLVVVTALLRSRRQHGDLAAWIPLVLWPALYAEVPTVIAGLGSSFHDGSVQAWELALFGQQPARTLAAALPNRVLSEVLHAGYLSYYGLIYLPPALLFARAKRAEFASTVFALTTVWLACLVVFVVFPVAGPRYLWGEPTGVPNGPMRSLATWLLELGSSRGTAFPSSHVAVTVVQSVVALRFQRPVGMVATVLTALLAVGAVYGGFHYAVDVVAGVGLGLLVVRVVTAGRLHGHPTLVAARGADSGNATEASE
jgi:membrane-associated phospholipid phosphatase